MGGRWKVKLAASAIDAGQPSHDSKFSRGSLGGIARFPARHRATEGKGQGRPGPSHSASTRKFASMSYRDQQSLLGEMVMVELGSPLHAFSDHAAELVERTAGSVVAVHGGGR